MSASALSLNCARHVVTSNCSRTSSALNTRAQRAARCTTTRVSARSSVPAISCRTSVRSSQSLLSCTFTQYSPATRSVRVAAVQDDKSSVEAEAPQQQKGDSQESTVDSAAVLEEARLRTGGSFVFSHDETDEDADVGPVSRFEEKMAAQAAAAVEDAAPEGVTADAPIASATEGILSAYSQEQGFEESSVQEVHKMRGANSEIFMLDVRTTEEFAKIHAVGAVNIPLNQLSAESKGGKLPHVDTPICVICQSGRRSAQAAVKLGKVLGFTDVTNVEGGTSAWAAAELPVEQ